VLLRGKGHSHVKKVPGMFQQLHKGKDAKEYGGEVL
jgi:hypothetical protein